MYNGLLVLMDYVPYRCKDPDTKIWERKKAVFITLEVNGSYLTFNIYDTLAEYFPKVTKRLITNLERNWQGENFLVAESLDIKNLEDIIERHMS